MPHLHHHLTKCRWSVYTIREWKTHPEKGINKTLHCNYKLSSKGPIRIIMPKRTRLKYVPSTQYSQIWVKAGWATRVSNRGKDNREGVWRRIFNRKTKDNIQLKVSQRSQAVRQTGRPSTRVLSANQGWWNAKMRNQSWGATNLNRYLWCHRHRKYKKYEVYVF